MGLLFKKTIGMRYAHLPIIKEGYVKRKHQAQGKGKQRLVYIKKYLRRI